MNVGNKQNKKVLILIVIALIITVTSLIFYIINLHLKSNVVIDLDFSEIELSVNLNNKSKGVLVPIGRVTNSSETDTFTFEYYVLLNDKEQEMFNELLVSVKEVIIVGTDLNHLVIINIDNTGDKHIYEINGETIVVSIKVNLKEPEDEEEYLAIINKEIKITLNFKVN